MFIEEIKQKFYSLMYTRKGEILFFLLLILIGLIIYKDVFFYKYTGADFFAQIAGNSNINDALAAPLSADFLGDNWYRPVDAVTIYLNYEIGGLDPFIYQLTNMIIFISALLLVYIFVKQIFKSVKLAFFSSAIFLIYPLTMRILPLVTFRAEMLLTLFMLLTLILIYKYYETKNKTWQILAVVSAFLTISSKEAGFVMMPLFVGFFIIMKNRDKEFAIKKFIVNIIPYLAVIAFYFILVFTLLGQYTARGMSTGTKGASYLIFDRLRAVVAFFESIVYPVDVFGLNNMITLELGGESIGIGYMLIGLITVILLLWFIRFIFKLKINIKKILNFQYLSSFFTKDMFLIFWVMIYFAFFIFYGKYNWYYGFLLIPAASIFIAKLYLEQKQPLKKSIKKILILIFIIYSIIALPVITSYSNYKTSSDIKEDLVPEIFAQTKNIPDNATYYIVNYFGGALGNGYAAGIPPHSINGLLYLKYSERNWKYIQVSQFVLKNADKKYNVDYQVIKNDNSFTIELSGDNVRFYKSPAKSSHPMQIRENVNVSGYLYPKESINLSITFDKYNNDDYIMLFYSDNSEIQLLVEKIGDFLNKT